MGPHLQALELSEQFLGFCHYLLWNNSEKATNTNNMNAIWAELWSEILPRSTKDKTVRWKGRYPEEINPTSTERMSWLGRRWKQCGDRLDPERTVSSHYLWALFSLSFLVYKCWWEYLFQGRLFWIKRYNNQTRMCDLIWILRWTNQLKRYFWNNKKNEDGLGIKGYQRIIMFIFWRKHPYFFFFKDMHRCRDDIIWVLEFALPS